jgi:glutamate formiminotransferase
MAKIVECVPNFSEGRRPEVVKAIVDAVAAIEGVKVLNYSSDPDHNRSVLTFVGHPEAVKKGAFAGCAKAAELIDMDIHKGEHPRIGATDVIPFIPVSNVSMEECVAIAHEVGERIAKVLGIPVYFYEAAAKREHMRALPNVRKGDYEGLKEAIKTPERAPDAGPNIMPKAGATVVGARQFLIAFNINLGTKDVSIAKKVAQTIREIKGGYKYCRAIGLMIEEKGVAQVSINLTNFTETPMHRVFETVKSEAARYGVNVVGSEVIGLTPLQALVDTAAFYLRIDDFSRNQVLEAGLIEE